MVVYASAMRRYTFYAFVFDDLTDSMPHTCSNALVRCMDFRLGSAVRDYMKENDLYDDTDIIAVAGAAKDIAQEDGSYVEDQVNLSKKLHNIGTIILMNHTDCGGYGGRDTFASREAEHAKHISDLQQAKAKLKAQFPDVKIKLLLADILDDGSVDIQDVTQAAV